jgi:hypothetical protein
VTTGATRRDPCDESATRTSRAAGGSEGVRILQRRAKADPLRGRIEIHAQAANGGGILIHLVHQKDRGSAFATCWKSTSSVPRICW